MNQAVGDVYVVPKGIGLEQNVYLLNFGVNKSHLKQEHIEALVRYVMPIVVSGGYAAILGMTSRSGSYLSNLSLSQRRARAVSTYLSQKAGIPGTRLRQLTLGIGETTAALRGVKDGTESSLYRAVWISVTSKKALPPPPPPPRNLSNKYSCATKTADRGYYDRINNSENWIIKGASGNYASLRSQISIARSFYTQNLYSEYPNSANKSILQFYESGIFAIWYVDGFCGLERLVNTEYALQKISSFNTVEGQKRKGMHHRMAGSFFK